MSTQTAIGHSFPTPCKRCGGALYRQVDYCPYCGAEHPLGESPYKRATVPGNRVSPINRAARQFDASDLPDEADFTGRPPNPGKAVARETARRTALMPTNTATEPLDDPPPYPSYRTGLTARKVLLATAVVFLIGFALILYVLFSDNSDSEDSSSDQAAVATQDDSRSTTGTIAPFSPAQANRPAATVKSANPDNVVKTTPVVPVTPVVPAQPAAPAAPPAPAILAKPAAPPAVTTPAKPATQFRDASQALQSARLAFRANDLSAAQAALAAAQSLQPGNTDAQNLAAEMRPLVARRDSALQAAQTCVAQQSWPCARQHANEALAIDTGNDPAKVILERVIRETGWAPLTPHAGAEGPAQGKPLAQAPTAAGSQAVQVQTPLPQGMPADSPLMAAAPRAGGANSLDAHERAIKDSGWSRSPSDGRTTIANATPGQ